MHKQRSIVAAAFVLLAMLGSGCRFIRNDDLNQAAFAGDQKSCEVLLSKGAIVHGAGMHGMRPIMSAAEGGNLETVRFLVAKGADVNAHNASGSALMWAVEADNAEMVRFLLLNGAESSWTNALGETALDFARRKQATEIIRLLEKDHTKAEHVSGGNGGRLR